MLEETVFGPAGPRTVVLTTPNREWNALFGLPGLRHGDHRFEWTRADLLSWAEGVCGRRGYSFAAFGVGPTDPEAGQPTQGAAFVRG